MLPGITMPAAPLPVALPLFSLTNMGSVNRNRRPLWEPAPLSRRQESLKPRRCHLITVSHLDDGQRGSSVGPEAGELGPEDPVSGPEREAFDGVLVWTGLYHGHTEDTERRIDGAPIFTVPQGRAASGRLQDRAAVDDACSSLPGVRLLASDLRALRVPVIPLTLSARILPFTGRSGSGGRNCPGSTVRPYFPACRHPRRLPHSLPIRDRRYSS